VRFLDEFGLNVARTRPYARAPRGERAPGTEPFHQGGHLSVISARGVHGVCAPRMIAGAGNSEVFDLDVEHLLVPCLRPGTLVLLDNVKFQSSPRALALIKEAGASVCPLPASSPAFKPIEDCIAKLKEPLPAFKARTKRKLTNALAKALALVTEGDIRGWFEHGGYVFSLK
jgi:transposase